MAERSNTPENVAHSKVRVKKEDDSENKPSEAVHPQNKYPEFCNENQGGKNKAFDSQCVYGEKGMTLEESLKRDGRLIDDLVDSTLSDSKNHDCFTKQKVDILKETPMKQIWAKGDSNVNIGNIHEDLKEMGKQFLCDSFQEVVKPWMADFGKTQQFFSEVHKVRELIELGKSVCKVLVGNGCEGTGFVLFDNLILTNAHLFKGCVDEDRKHLLEGINVSVLFNYNCPVPNTNYHCFTVKKRFIDYSDGVLDYAVLELNPEGQKADQTKTEEIPPGLLKRFGPVPLKGDACLIGHPFGGVKQIDLISIIEKEKREQAVNDHFEQYRNIPDIIQSIRQVIRNQGIENILKGGNKAGEVVTYNTFMYHGSSGSPVFDANCRLFGLHTRGFFYELKNHKESVIEFAQPLLTIFESLVTKIKESGNKELLKRVEEEAKGNPYLEKIVIVEPEDSDEPMDIE